MNGEEINKSGHNEEKNIVDLINDDLSFKLDIMSCLKNCKAEQSKDGSKTDVYLDCKVNVQVKSFKNSFNQVTRCKLNNFLKKVDFSEGTIDMFNKMCYSRIRIDSRYYEPNRINNLLIDIEKNKRAILDYAILGVYKETQPNFHILVKIMKTHKIIYGINTQDLLNYLYTQPVGINKFNSPSIGPVSIQRKGGDSGKITGNDIQIKIDLHKVINYKFNNMMIRHVDI
jgi:hypothetical protein